MTNCWYCSMTCCELLKVAVILKSLSKPTCCNRRALQHDFCADPTVSVNLQKQRVRQPAVDHVHFADAGPQAVEARLDLRQHPGVDDALPHQVAAACRVEVRDGRAGVCSVAEDAGGIRQEHQLFGLHVGGDGGGGGVGVDV